MFGAGHQMLDRREHLAAVADAERELAAIGEECAELIGQITVIADRRRPAAPGAEHVAIAEAAAGGEAVIVREPVAALDQIGHVHVEAVEAGAGERRRHLDFRVHALLAQDRQLRTRAGVDERRGDVLLRIERQSRRQRVRTRQH